MATPTYTQVVTRWYAVACTGMGTYLNHPFMRCDGDTLFGAGGVVMAQVLRQKNGMIRSFLLNGDGSASTRFRNQQWETRAVVQRQVFPNIILPFAALEAGQIERHTIIPIEVRDDQWITERTWFDNFDVNDVEWTGGAAAVGGYSENGKIPSRPELYFTRSTMRYTHSGYVPIPEAQRDSWNVYSQPGWRQLIKSGKRWYSETNIHRLGDSVFRAKAHGAYRTYLSSFDYQERNPLYFLAELPWKIKVENVQEAITALAPPIVQQAWAQKRVVRRQGDIFCIPTDLSKEQIQERTGAKVVRMEGVLGTDHVVTESYVGRRGVTYARGWMWHKPEGRRPDHGKVFLGENWHLVVPNAVPRRRAGAMVRG